MGALEMAEPDVFQIERIAFTVKRGRHVSSRDASLIHQLDKIGPRQRSPNTNSELLALTATYCFASTAYVIGPF